MTTKKNLRQFGLILFLTYLILNIAIAIIFLTNGFSFYEYLESIPEILAQMVGEPLFWLALSLPYWIFRLAKYWIKGFRFGGLKTFSRRFSFTFIAPVLAIFLFGQYSIWYKKSEDFTYKWDESAYNMQGSGKNYTLADSKIRGMHVFGVQGLDSLRITSLTKGNIEQLILVPYANQQDIDTPLSQGSFGRRTERRDSVYRAVVKEALKLQVEVIIKPHIWISNPSGGKWRADIWMDNEDDWQAWEREYEKFILHYAKLSEELNLPLYCIGNEFYLSTTKRTEFWKSLIKKVRRVYTGELFYGANWDREFQEIPFWDELDYIGIQAYFPLTDQLYPSLSEVKNGWGRHLDMIQSISEKYNRKVIFSELGYKSTPDAAKYPWGWESFFKNLFQRVSNQTQVYCYQAFFDQVWNQDWFAGAMIWQWQVLSDDEPINHSFSPKGKPAFNEIAKGFKLINNE